MSYRERQWMPFFVEDFKIDTLDLECDEVGVYFTMIMLAWARGDGAVPGDMLQLKKMLQRCISNFHGLTFNRIVPKLLDRYFEERLDGNFYQKRVVKELRIARERSENGSRNARERWSQVNKNKDLGDATAYAPAMLFTTQVKSKESYNEVSCETGVKTPRHGVRSADGRFVYFKRDTDEFAAYVNDYLEGTGDEPNATADGRWFKVYGEEQQPVAEKRKGNGVSSELEATVKARGWI
jgi:uncharacterized protein YdaU (DUF1376 family)